MPETSWTARLLGAWIAAYLRAVRPTLRVARVGRRPSRPNPRIDDAPAAVYAALHGDQIALAGTHAGGVAALASRSRDGGLAATVLAALGHRVRRGSSSAGGAAGLLGLRRDVRAGRSAVITVDGPRGPRGTASPGAGILARGTGRPLVPVIAACRPALRLRTWDALQVPLPFARVLVLYGRPLDARGPRAAVAARTTRALERLHRRAARLLERA